MNPIERLWATYEFKPLDRLVRREFYIWDEAIQRWQKEGMPLLAQAVEHGATQQPGEFPVEALAELFGYDEPGDHPIGMLGWCEPAFGSLMARVSSGWRSGRRAPPDLTQSTTLDDSSARMTDTPKAQLSCGSDGRPLGEDGQASSEATGHVLTQ